MMSDDVNKMIIGYRRNQSGQVCPARVFLDGSRWIMECLIVSNNFMIQAESDLSPHHSGGYFCCETQLLLIKSRKTA